MRRLMEFVLYEKRHGFQRIAFFLDSIAAALASHLIGHYSVGPSLIPRSVGGMTPPALRRCIALIEERLE